MTLTPLGEFESPRFERRLVLGAAAGTQTALQARPDRAEPHGLASHQNGSTHVGETGPETLNACHDGAVRQDRNSSTEFDIHMSNAC